MCVVEVEGLPRPVPSCATKVTEGMVIRTHSPRIETERRIVVAELEARRRPDGLLVDATHPYIQVDMTKCIDCYRCVRVCEDLEARGVWKVWNRGDEVEIHPDSGTTLLASTCSSCGACASTCPTGAIVDKTLIERGAPIEHTRTTCPYCGVGCELDVGTRDGKIVRVLPVMDAPVNKGHACVKGRYAWEFVESRDRLTAPLLRYRGGWREVSWAEAIAFVAERLRAIVAEHGPDAVGVLGSARSTNEENYVAQKLARVVLGTNNVDCCARVCHAPSAKALSKMLGTGAATSSFDDIERAETIMVCGANATEGHPVVGARIRRRAQLGANLIVIDPRRIELARERGAIHLQVRLGGNVPLLDAMASVVVEEGLVDEAFVRDRVDGAEELYAFLARFRPEDLEHETGVPAALVRRAARVYAKARPAICFHGLGMTEHVQGTEGVMALVNLSLLTGNVGRPGTGVNPLRGQNNVQGAAHMGCEPAGLTGLAKIAEAAPRFERAWRAPLPRARGKTLMSMIDAAARGELKALWAMGYDVLLTNPSVAETRKSLGALDLLVVQDIFMNETARELAHVVLPAAASFEKDGTFMNAERRVQRVRRAVDPPGQARPDWEPLCELARAMGHADGFAFESAEQIWEEIRSVWPDGRGITYARLEHGGLQWPCPDESHPGTALLHEHAFTAGPRVALRCISHTPTAQRPSPEYPLVLNTGRSLFQFNAGTMTMRTRNRALRATDRLEMSPADAERLGLRDGESVRVRSPFGQAVLPLHVSDRVARGEVFATFNDPDRWVNAVTGGGRDSLTETPEFKVTAVAVERAEERARP
jgi:formate dehydrogenase major subunit